MITTQTRAANLGATPAETHGYISDVLSQLADLARGCGDQKLEGAMRLLAVEAATHSDLSDPQAPSRPRSDAADD